MNDLEDKQGTGNLGVWPPAPTLDELKPQFMSANGVDLTESGGRLVVVNKFNRRLVTFTCLCYASPFLFPFLMYLAMQSHHAVVTNLPTLLPYILATYLQIWPVLLFVVLIDACWWLFFYFYSNYGIVLDKKSETVKAIGRLRPMSEIGAIQIIRMKWEFYGRRFIVLLLFSADKPTLHGKKARTGVRSEKWQVGAIRNEANAEKMAQIIADFAGVSVQHISQSK